MAGVFRTEWRNFKKKHPEFEKNRSFKGDLGPMLDQLEKFVDEANDAEVTYENEHATQKAVALEALRGVEGAITLLRDKNAPEELVKPLRAIEVTLSNGRGLDHIEDSWEKYSNFLKQQKFDVVKVSAKISTAVKAESIVRKASALEDRYRRDAIEIVGKIKTTMGEYLKIMRSSDDKFHMVTDFDKIAANLSAYCKKNKIN